MMQRSEDGSRDEDAGAVAFNDVFSLRRPRDARAGLASGAKSIAKGLLAGVQARCTYGQVPLPLDLALLVADAGRGSAGTAGLIAAPIAGAVQSGVKGFALGCAAGAPAC